MTGTILLILGIVLIFILITAPLEALEWWVDWIRDDPAIADILPSANEIQDAPCFIVYMTGIGTMEPETHAWREQQLFEQLQEKLPDAVLVNQIFPYSMNNVALTGHRFFSRLWRITHWLRDKARLSFAQLLANIRNITQVAVSIDHRYGPIYNRGSAELVRKALAHSGYPFGADVPVILIGYSGGVQIATGAVPFLKPHLNGPLLVISIGGVFASGKGHMLADRYLHIVGERDPAERIGRILFGRRWPIWRRSHWNRALAAGRVQIARTHSRAHTGRGGYLDPKSGPAEESSYLDETVMIITDAARRLCHK